MLSRTADNLYWLARYMERADTAARALEVGARIALMPNTGHGYRNEWDALLQASGTADIFRRKYGDAVQRNLESHFFFDTDNPSSVATGITRARENGRIVRTALTAQVWDALNSAFQELRGLERAERSELSLSRLTDWTLNQSALVRGAIDATLLRNDGYQFLNLGYHLERADNTARLLDVKYYVLLPKADYVGSGLDNYQWSTLLRAMSVHRAFRWAYGGDVTAGKIADFLILNNQCPRSLICCAEGVQASLTALARLYRRESAAQDAASALLHRLRQTSVEEIFEEGMHEFLTRFIREVAMIGQTVHEVYLSGDSR